MTIHAQAAVNELFADALEAAAEATSAVSTGSATETTGATTGTAVEMTSSATQAPSGPPALTVAEVTSLFDKITSKVPTAVANDFATLKTAATSMTTEPAGTVVDILDDQPVVDAMKAITDYISSCTPESTD